MARDPVLDTKWLKPAEVATMVRLSKMTVYRRVNSGELPSARIGREFRIPEEAVVAWLKSKMPAHD